MGYFVNVNTKAYRTYQILDKLGYEQFFNVFRHLKYYKYENIGMESVKETYYDTPNDMLLKSGILLSKIEEGNRCFIRVENKAYDDANISDRQIFVHPIAAKDSIYDHAFYVKDGITSLFLTSFSIDLENVLKQVVPKIKIEAKANVYKILNGAGLKIECALEQRRYYKLAKKKADRATHKNENLIVKLITNDKVFAEEFEKFNNALQKYCKSLLRVDESQSKIAERVLNKQPKPIEPNGKDVKK